MFKGLLRLLPYTAALLTLAGATQAAEGLRVFTGTLGKAPIVAELSTQESGEVYGRYFYTQYHHDLALSGAVKNNTLTLEEGNNRFASDKSLPTLTLKATANGWQGEWQDPQGKRLPVQLAEAPAQQPAPLAVPFVAGLAQNDLYEYLRLQALKLEPARSENFMGYTLQWWTEPESKISLFTVESGFARAQQQQINERLLGRLWSEVINYHSCLLGGAEHAEFNQHVTPAFLSADLLSVDISTDYYCGGAHSDFSRSPINLNIRSGELLELADVLEVGAATGDVSAIDPQKVLAQWLVEQFTRLYPNHMKQPTAEDDCDYTDDSVWGYSNWYFTPKGLYLGAYFARYQRNCDDPEWSVLPYSLVSQHPGAVRLQLPRD